MNLYAKQQTTNLFFLTRLSNKFILPVIYTGARTNNFGIYFISNGFLDKKNLNFYFVAAFFVSIQKCKGII